MRAWPPGCRHYDLDEGQQAPHCLTLLFRAHGVSTDITGRKCRSVMPMASAAPWLVA